MYISTEIGSFRAYGDDCAIIRFLKEGGFDAYDYSMLKPQLLTEDDYLEKAKKIRAYADEIGIVCNQTHAPFPTKKLGDTEYNEWVFKTVVRALEVTSVLGGRICVVHPCNNENAEGNAKFYLRLEPYARKYGVKIALENMWNRDEKGHNLTAACSHHEDFRRHLDLLPADVFVACLDIGHAEMGGLQTSAVQMIETLSSRLQAIHLHDNDLYEDTHELPYCSRINFGKIIEALKKVGYQGDITMEADRYIRKFPLELYPAGARFMASIADDFRKKVQK